MTAKQHNDSERGLVEEVEAVLANTTPEPWFDFGGGEWLHEPKALLARHEDAVLIARAPELLRRLVEEVKRLRVQAVEDKKAFDDLYEIWKKEVGARWPCLKLLPHN